MNIEKSKDAEPAADSYDTYILTELNFPDSDRNALYGRVRKIVRNYYGQYIGVVNRNSILDTSKYKVEYLDGYIEEITTNRISKNMLSHIDSQGNHFLLLKEINDHCKDASEINRANGFM